MHEVHVDDLYNAIDQACNELNDSVTYGRSSTRIYNTLIRNFANSITSKTIDISIIEELTDKQLKQVRGCGSESVKIIRRTIDILNGAEPLINQTYTLTITNDDVYILKKMLEHKEKEIKVIKKILNSREKE